MVKQSEWCLSLRLHPRLYMTARIHYSSLFGSIDVLIIVNLVVWDDTEMPQNIPKQHTETMNPAKVQPYTSRYCRPRKHRRSQTSSLPGCSIDCVL